MRGCDRGVGGGKRGEGQWGGISKEETVAHLQRVRAATGARGNQLPSTARAAQEGDFGYVGKGKPLIDFLITYIALIGIE